MSHMLLEIIVWSLVAFALGCLIGCLLRKVFGAEEVVVPAVAAAATATVAVARTAMPVAPRAPEPPAHVPPRPAPVAEPVILAPIPAVPAPEPLAAAAIPAGKPERPKGIAKARGGKADNLQRISGVGPKNEKVLHSLAFSTSTRSPNGPASRWPGWMTISSSMAASSARNGSARPACWLMARKTSSCASMAPAACAARADHPNPGRGRASAEW